MPKLGLVDGGVKVVNVSGSGGGKAFSHVVTTRNNDENLIVAASAATATRLAQKVYGDFKADDVKWIVPVSILVAISFYIIFDRILGLNLPAGILSFF